MAGCSWALLHLHRDWAHPPRASAPGLQVLPEDMLKLVPPSAPALIDALTHAILYDVHEVLSIPPVCVSFVFACVPVFGFCLNAPACLPHACEVSARAHVFTPRAFALQVDPMQFHQAVRKYYSWHDVAARTELVYRSGIIRCNGVPVP